MSNAFHLSLFVDDLDRSKAYYRALGCTVGREKATWFDLDFFGHQVTMHQARRPQPRIEGVGPSKRSIDHFGIITSKARWCSLLDQFEAQGADFRVRPRRSDVGGERERGKFVVVDPDGVGLEFKYWANPQAATECE